jgi:hypothetical protein
MENKDKKEQELENKLNKILNIKKDCQEQECLIKDNTELVQREHKKIVTNDGRQLLSEYTR